MVPFAHATLCPTIRGFRHRSGNKLQGTILTGERPNRNRDRSGQINTARLISPFNPIIEGQADHGGCRAKEPARTMGWVFPWRLKSLGREDSESVKRTETSKGPRPIAGFCPYLRGRLARAFYQPVPALERLALQRRTEELNRNLLDVTKVKFDAGDVSALEVNVAVVRYGQTRKETFDAEENVTQALLELRRLIGGRRKLQSERKARTGCRTASCGAVRASHGKPSRSAGQALRASAGRSRNRPRQAAKLPQSYCRTVILSRGFRRKNCPRGNLNSLPCPQSPPR